VHTSNESFRFLNSSNSLYVSRFGVKYYPLLVVLYKYAHFVLNSEKETGGRRFRNTFFVQM